MQKEKLAYSISETATLISIAAKTIRNQLSLGVFPIRVSKVGGRVIIAHTDIIAFLSGNQKKAGRPRGRLA